MRKAAHPSSGVDSSNPAAQLLHHHGDGVCEVVCAFSDQVSLNNLNIRLSWTILPHPGLHRTWYVRLDVLWISLTRASNREVKRIQVMKVRHCILQQLALSKSAPFKLGCYFSFPPIPWRIMTEVKTGLAYYIIFWCWMLTVDEVTSMLPWFQLAQWWSFTNIIVLTCLVSIISLFPLLNHLKGWRSQRGWFIQDGRGVKAFLR